MRSEVVAVVLLGLLAFWITLVRGGNVTAMLVFGDSTVDPGNNNGLGEAPKADYPPYGMDFFGGKATGRFSDGRLATDLISESLGISTIIPAFLDPKLQQEQLKYGVSFASASSGYDMLTASKAKIHRLGATRFVMFGVPPIGCVPMIRSLEKSDGCVTQYNSAAISYNTKLIAVLDVLEKTLGVRTAYIDVYGISMEAIKDPRRYGFLETSKGCCGSGMTEVGDTCKGQTTCKDPSTYMFFDAAHPTESMYQLLVDKMALSALNKVLD